MHISELKAKHLELRKARSPHAKVVGMLVAEFEDFIRQNKEVSEDMVCGKIRKYIENAYDNAKLSGDAKCAVEAEFLETLLPEMLSEGDLLAILMDSGASNIGEFMKHLRTNHPGQYDGKVASKVARENL